MQLLVISSKSLAEKQLLGDIVAVLSDTHIFSPHELDIFTIIKGVDEKEVEAARPEIISVKPKISALTVDDEYAKLVAASKEGDKLPTKVNLKAQLEMDGTKQFRIAKDKTQIELKDAEMPRYELRYEAGKVIENYTRAYAEAKAVKG
jgi:hypothetical protein